MNILIGLVIAIFIVAAVYVGYHAMQNHTEAEGHDIELEFQNKNTRIIQAFQNTILFKVII
ncbi:MAG: hypothetical protein HC944_06890 [Nanoarchaeota archaeon]|nr:hypothetical protein [Nanoarchaeota archaeon]